LISSKALHRAKPTAGASKVQQKRKTGFRIAFDSHQSAVGVETIEVGRPTMPELTWISSTLISWQPGKTRQN
jgi:hypothetical protein